ncbi:AraC family transcriptional regulator [Jiangella asiatica]|uniref:AraC family transcriptional regulator n=1 Tax=Jiangella asiatica TaxID=2530372 RepID=A0A4R5CSN5_9ACTN|nr:AraC family transcriptional regulator [Jiangella asiatica]TDE02577.1 AraC family transcriptional regulator [Jiangella asiatica]
MSVTTGHWAPTDPLGEALHQLRMNGAFYSRAELTAPWGLTLPAMPGHIWFHVVTSGPAWLRTEDADPRRLLPGELALVPHGMGHEILGAPGAPAPNVMDLEREAVSDRYELIRYGGGGDPTILICGAVRFDHPAARRLVQTLPETIHVEVGGSPQLDWVHSTLRLMADEARQLRPGGEEVITRLGDILVIQAIRTWIDTDAAARTGWLGALQDEQIGRAISLIHKRPEHDWSVASLAAELAMSRSAFAERFTRVVGEPVMQYLTIWRMNLALDALRHEQATAAQLAHRLGYRSEAAFARAFKRVIGLPPGAVKRGAETPAS